MFKYIYKQIPHHQVDKTFEVKKKGHVIVQRKNQVIMGNSSTLPKSVHNGADFCKNTILPKVFGGLILDQLVKCLSYLHEVMCMIQHWKTKTKTIKQTKNSYLICMNYWQFRECVFQTLWLSFSMLLLFLWLYGKCPRQHYYSSPPKTSSSSQGRHRATLYAMCSRTSHLLLLEH